MTVYKKPRTTALAALPLALTLAGSVTLPRLAQAATGASPGVFENYAEAWERYQREVVAAAQAERSGNRERAEEARRSAARAAAEAETRRVELERISRERAVRLASLRADLEREQRTLETLRTRYDRADAAASTDRLNDRWWRPATAAMRSADAAAGTWRDQSGKVETLRRQVAELSAQETSLTEEMVREQTAARAAQGRIDTAAAAISANPDLTPAERQTRGIQAARDFFTSMSQQGYDARFLLMDTRLLGAQADLLKQALDTQLNSTLLGHYVNSQVEKIGKNFCSLAAACTASDPAQAAGVPARIRALLEGTREQAAAAASTTRSEPRPGPEEPTRAPERPAEGTPAASSGK